MLPPPARRYRELLYFAKIISAGRDGAIRRTGVMTVIADGPSDKKIKWVGMSAKCQIDVPGSDPHNRSASKR
jgi:hypothetical protein